MVEEEEEEEEEEEVERADEETIKRRFLKMVLEASCTCLLPTTSPVKETSW